MNEESQQKQQPIPVLDPRLLYCDSTFISTEENGESFIFSFSSGGVITAQFCFSPKHAKRLKLLLDSKLEAYEKTHGELKTELPS